MTDTHTETITITVDGKEISCCPNELLIDVAKRAGIYIPFFCYHPRMDPVGACRMCLVHIEGAPPKPQTSCTTRVNDGMVVQTQFTNPEIQTAQQGVLEFLLINHPLDCPICDRGGECPLQDQVQDYGPTESRYIEPKRRFPKPVPISSLVMLDRERCILCYRCTRFCEELSGDTLIGVMDRGPRSYIFPYEGEAFDSYFSGNTVQICPVGALTSAPYRFQARPWDLRHTSSTCNMCASGCSLEISQRVQDGKVVRFSARTNDEVNHDWLCDKGRYATAYITSEGRLTQPQVRTDSGLVPLSWDDALRTLSERLDPMLSGASGRAAVLCGGSLTDEDYYAAQKFARVTLRTNAVDHRLDGGMTAEAPLPPSLSYDDVTGSDRVVLVSLDAREELPILFLRLRIAHTKQNVALSLVHPRRIALSEFASHALQPYPGTDALVGAALAAALGQPVAAGTEAMAAAAGINGADIRAFGEALQSAERPVILLGSAVVRDPDAVRAWRAVAQACGARVSWAARRAGEAGAVAAGAHPGLLPGWRAVSDPGARDEVATAWGAELPSEPGPDAVDVLRRAAAGDMDMLWLIGADVLGDVPDAQLGADALGGARFVVVQDIRASHMLEHADIVLPAAAYTERAGTYTDWEGRRQPAHQAVDPPGAARADYAILSEVARRLERPIGCRRLADVRTEIDDLLRFEVPVAGADADTVRPQGPSEDGEYPLRLCTYRLLYDAGSRASHTPGIREHTPSAFVEMHADDAARLGIEDGAPVLVSSRHGSVTLPATVSRTVRPGVVFVPYAQPQGTARDLLSIDDPHPGVRVERA